MATKLKKMKLISVDLVRAGANQEASIELFKSADGGPVEVPEKLRAYNFALTESLRTIRDDESLTDDERRQLADQSQAQYREAVSALFAPEGKPDGADWIDEIEETGGSRYDTIEETGSGQIDTIEEVRKFNPFHDALGGFASKRGFKTYSANPKSGATC